MNEREREKPFYAYYSCRGNNMIILDYTMYVVLR